MRGATEGVAQKPPLVDEDLVIVESRDSSGVFALDVLLHLMRDPVPITPWFYMGDGLIQSPQENLFGFYALRNLIRFDLIGYRFYRAGQLLLLRGYLAAAIAMFYTAAFQLLHALLALYGRVAVEPVRGRARVVIESSQAWGEYASLPGDPAMIMGILTQQNKWIFERRKRNHASRWRELKNINDIWNVNQPVFLTEFFHYLCSYFGDLVVDESEVMNEGLRRLAEGRHESLYSGYGFDVTALDAITEYEGTSGGLDGKAREYRKFARALLLFCTSGLVEAKASLADSIDGARLTLVATVFNPAFEIEWTSVENDDELNQLLDDGLTWVFKKWR